MAFKSFISASQKAFRLLKSFLWWILSLEFIQLNIVTSNWSLLIQWKYIETSYWMSDTNKYFSDDFWNEKKEHFSEHQLLFSTNFFQIFKTFEDSFVCKTSSLWYQRSLTLNIKVSEKLFDIFSKSLNLLY